MTASTDTHDAMATLTELERKLVELERELSGIAAGGEPAPPVADAAPDVPAPAERDDELAELLRFRDRLEAATRELMAEYDRLLERLRQADRAGSASSAP